MTLAVFDLDANSATNVAGADGMDVVRVRWLNDERLMFQLVDRDHQFNTQSGLYAVNRDGSRPQNLLGALQRIERPMSSGAEEALPWGLTMVGEVRSARNEIIALGHFINRNVEAYQLNAETGRGKLIAANVTGLPRNFWFDEQAVLRVVETTTATGADITLWYRGGSGQEWRVIANHKALDRGYRVVGFDADGSSMLVTANTAEGRLGLYRFDFVTNKPGELLASDRKVDVGGDLVRARDTGKLLGVRIPSDPPRTHWLDAGLNAIQEAIDRAIPGAVNRLTPLDTHAPIFVDSYASTQAGRYLLYHPTQKKLQTLLAKMPGLDPKQLAEQRTYEYKARDGLTIPAYLTLPPGRELRNLPMVVWVHGGPWSRDVWGFDPEVQFLAQMGYVVLQPQFRGSAGYGREHDRRGDRQWGLAMQDDVTDGVTALVKTGAIDGKRVCIGGASYGGYSAMMGLVRDAALYRCGINLVGVTHIPYLFSSNNYWGVDRESNYVLGQKVGDMETHREQFNATSPLRQAAKISAPVFMAYGERDARVPIAHGTEMRDALKREGKTVEFMEVENEGHGFFKEESRYKVWRAIEAFLRKHNPPH